MDFQIDESEWVLNWILTIMIHFAIVSILLFIYLLFVLDQQYFYIFICYLF
ncbi:hypothetical protein Hdeb2414_s0453g00897121 [Helianthus debilis subsp. tardiflorus]